VVRRKLWRAPVAHSRGGVAGALVLRAAGPVRCRTSQEAGRDSRSASYVPARSARPPFVRVAGAAR
jgi:hypothetical protein